MYFCIVINQKKEIMKHTTKEIVEKFKQMFGDKYDYSKVEYKSFHTPVCVTCNIHGDFWQMPQTLLHGFGCPTCSKERRRKNTEANFLEKAKEIHGNFYDYSKVVFVDKNTPVEIVCPIHGSFWQRPNIHTKRCGCPKCGRENSTDSNCSSTEEFVKKAKEVWGDANDYTNTIYERYNKPLKVVCSRHGAYMVHPYRHLHLGVGCPICSQEKFHEKTTLTQEEFIARCKDIHGDEYDYAKTAYTGNRNSVIITCRKHGDFTQNAANHLKGHGCPTCMLDKLSDKKKKSQEQFITDATNVHGVYYDYSLVDYHGCFTKVKIVCPKHGVFEQTPSTHLKGSGCPICRKSKGEERVSAWLKKSCIRHELQYKIPNDFKCCANKNIVVDFYLPDYNSIIEYNGEQHYNSVKLWGGDERLKKQQERDVALRLYCRKHNIKLIEIPFTKFDNIELILNKKINNNGNNREKK